MTSRGGGSSAAACAILQVLASNRRLGDCWGGAAHMWVGEGHLSKEDFGIDDFIKRGVVRQPQPPADDRVVPRQMLPEETLAEEMLPEEMRAYCASD